MSLVVNSEDCITDLLRKMENQSVLKFTYEIGYDKLPFLDVSIKINNDHFQTSVFKKLTNTGDRLNYFSECPKRYKTGVINTICYCVHTKSHLRLKYFQANWKESGNYL